ncbi:hypothetical protein IAT38_001521 [Cryptococcus sp. DSM 104549]
MPATPPSPSPFLQSIRVDPDSPSSVFLRELQEPPSDDPNQSVYRTRHTSHASSQAPLLSESLDASSPGAGPSSGLTGSTSGGTGTMNQDDGSEDDETPPRSVMFGDQRPAWRDASASALGRSTQGAPDPFGDDTPKQSSSGSRPTPNSGQTQATPTIPTFREPPSLRNPTLPPPRSASASHRDPSLAASTSRDLSKSKSGSKAKGKDKSKAGSKRGRDGRGNYELARDIVELGVLGSDGSDGEGGRQPRKMGLNDYEKALWKWVNVEDLDGFLQEVYEHYRGKGAYCIAYAKLFDLLTHFFVIWFWYFLTSCVNWSTIWAIRFGPSEGQLRQLEDFLVPHCVTVGGWIKALYNLALAAYCTIELIKFVYSLPRILDMYRFYTHLLGIPDDDIQTVPWPEIVRLIGEIREHNPVTSLANGQASVLAGMVGEDNDYGQFKKLDAHDIANRILRQENYFIALFNKDLLDLRPRIRIPTHLARFLPRSMLVQPVSPSSLSASHAGQEADGYTFVTLGSNTLTKAVEWNLRFCLLGYFFDERGQVRKEFVRGRRKKELVEGLRKRFIFMAWLNCLLSPFIVAYITIYTFFRYLQEWHSNVSAIASRQYTLYAEWKFREFNELPHLFKRRLNTSYPAAKEYVDQFPNERMAPLMRFVAYVSGSFASVLLILSIIDFDFFLHFEILPGVTVPAALTVFGGIRQVARGMVPNETVVFDPQAGLEEVVKYTHYLPREWRGKMHSRKVHQAFGELFALKVSIFFTELLSVLLTPFILLWSLPPCAGAVVDFFREFTLHVEGIGYVCSFAVFDFERPEAVGAGGVGGKDKGKGKGKEVSRGEDDEEDDDDGANAGGRDHLLPNPTTTPSSARPPSTNLERHWRANETKMEKSFLHFKASHPDWQPANPSSSIYLDKLMGAQREHQQRDHRGQRGSASMLAESQPYAGRHLSPHVSPRMGRSPGLALKESVIEEDEEYRSVGSWDRSRVEERYGAESGDGAGMASGSAVGGRSQGGARRTLREPPRYGQQPSPAASGSGVGMGSGEMGRGQSGGTEREGEEDEELWRKDGVVGLLQEVMKR